MDKEKGLPSLPDKSVDLCLTDIFYNINATITKGIGFNNKRINVEVYNDLMKPEEYRIFCSNWFQQIKRICNMLIFTCGKTNLRMWYEIDNFDLLCWFIPNSSSRGFVSKFIYFEPLLCYGNFKKNKLKSDVIRAMVQSGFLCDNKLIHPHPKPIKLYEKILSEIKPESVLDPFLGSGTTAEVCTKLGIPWLGYEINEVYKVDIEKRLKNCKKEPSQVSLLKFQEVSI